MIFLWFLLGVVAVVIAFFLPGKNVDLWPNLNSAGIVAALYLIGVIAFVMRKPFAVRTQVKTWIAAAVFGGAIFLWWTGMESTTRWQRENLVEIRSVIGRGIIYASIPDSLLDVLSQYHQQRSAKKISLGSLFSRNYLGGAVGTNVHHARDSWDSLKVFLTALSDTQVVLTAQEAYARGRNPQFRNVDGRSGLVQERFTLTEKGVVHESEN